MPNKITAYSCKFKCRKVLTKKRSMIEHEEICFKNTKSRSCATCDHFESDSTDNLNGNKVDYPIQCSAGINLESKLHTQCNSYITKG